MEKVLQYLNTIIMSMQRDLEKEELDSTADYEEDYDD